MAGCACGSRRESELCCGVFLSGEEIAPTAEALMRSRYSAFCGEKADYLLQTWHPSTRPSALDFSGDTTRWLKLEVLETVSGQREDARGVVEFKAYFEQGGQRQVLHERSSFIREQGTWYYVDGIMQDSSSSAKPSRNKSCPCGSGKKYKRCCG